MRLSIRAMPRHSQKSSPPDIAVRRTASFRRLCRWSMRSSSRQTLGGKRLKCRTTAWIAGLLVEDGASRLLPGNDEQKESKERKKKSEAKRRQTQCVFCRAVRARPRLHTGGAHLSAFHRGSRPKKSFIARDSAPAFCFLGLGGTRFEYPFERALPAPACPSPANFHRGLVVVLGG